MNVMGPMASYCSTARITRTSGIRLNRLQDRISGEKSTELRTGYQHTERAPRDRSQERVRSTLQDFEAATRTDLTPNDDRRLVGEVERSLQGLLGEVVASAKAGIDQLPAFGSLKTISLVSMSP
jgi:hypothetical protein